MAALTCRSHLSGCLARSSKPRVSRPRTVVYASDPKFTLENSPQAAEGFVEKDTAGQSNMYPTVMKPYEAGSSSDTVQQETFNTGLAVGTSVFALLAIGAGLTVLVGTSGSPPTSAVVPEEQYKPLSAYSAKFSAEVGPVRKAPAVAAAPVAVPEPQAEVAAAVEAADIVTEVATAVVVAEAVAETVADSVQ